MIRSLLILAALIAAPAAASERVALRASVTVTADVVTLGDLLGEGAPSAATALFRAPELGTYGTIQAWRIVEAARSYGLTVEAGQIGEVRVERAARSVGEIELIDLITNEAMRRFGVDDRARVELRLDGPALPAQMDAAPDAGLVVERFSQDAATSRFEAVLIATEANGRRSRALRITGVAIELVDTMRLRRSVARGDVNSAADLAVERVPRTRLPSDVVTGASEIAGHAARRAMTEGTMLRAGDLERRRVIARNDPVTIFLESQHLNVTARGRAIEGGAVGDTIDVQNTNSRRTLQAVVVGPGRVSIRLSNPRHVAAARPAPAQPNQPASPSR
jgi:flagella basal body P-ring formation protein FlgA